MAPRAHRRPHPRRPHRWPARRIARQLCRRVRPARRVAASRNPSRHSETSSRRAHCSPYRRMADDLRSTSALRDSPEPRSRLCHDATPPPVLALLGFDCQQRPLRRNRTVDLEKRFAVSRIPCVQRLALHRDAQHARHRIAATGPFAGKISPREKRVFGYL